MATILRTTTFSMNENDCILTKIFEKFVSEGAIDNM